MDEVPEGVGPIDVPADRADDKKMGSLHGVVAEYLTLAIASGNCAPALIGAAITFLKNNNITASAATNEKLDALRTALAAKRQRGGKLTPKAMSEANDAFAGMMGDINLQ